MKNVIIASGIVELLAFFYSATSDKNAVKSPTTSNVEESFNYQSTFNGYECTDDCSGHKAGYEWAEENGIESVDDCGGNSNSFIEGCESFVEENYAEEDYYEEDYDYMY